MRAAIAVIALVLTMLPGAAEAQYRPRSMTPFPAPVFASRRVVEARAAYIREHILASAGLLPLPDRTPLNPVGLRRTETRRLHRVEGVLESLPGASSSRATCTARSARPVSGGAVGHGHWTYGRFENSPLVSAPGAPSPRSAGLRRLRYDMIGYNDSRQLTHTFGRTVASTSGA